MSLIDDSLAKIGDCQFLYNDQEETTRQIEIRNAVLVYKNFSGAKTRFSGNAPAPRNFNFVISEAVRDALLNGAIKSKGKPLKVNIHQIGGREEGDPVLYFINVKVNMRTDFPPKIFLHTNFNGVKKRTALSEETINTLDTIDLSRCDLKVNVRESSQREGWAVFYLGQLYCLQSEVREFGGAYADWDDDPLSPANEPNIPLPINEDN